jgi:hypothetical protein
MCPAVCVGSLVFDRPLTGQVRPGELITFHPPGVDSETYTHQVVRVLASGAIQTKGLGNPAPDPWLITERDIVGVGVFSLWGGGWILKALPFALMVIACWIFGRPLVRNQLKPAWDTASMTVLVVLPALMLRPLVRAVVTATTVDKRHAGWQTLTLVNTGLLPASFSAKGGARALVDPGRKATLSGAAIHGHAVVTESVMLPLWGWLLVGLVVVSPLIRYMFHALRAYERPTRAGAKFHTVQFA